MVEVLERLVEFAKSPVDSTRSAIANHPHVASLLLTAGSLTLESIAYQKVPDPMDVILHGTLSNLAVAGITERVYEEFPAGEGDKADRFFAFNKRHPMVLAGALFLIPGARALGGINWDKATLELIPRLASYLALSYYSMIAGSWITNTNAWIIKKTKLYKAARIKIATVSKYRKSNNPRVMHDTIKELSQGELPLRNITIANLYLEMGQLDTAFDYYSRDFNEDYRSVLQGNRYVPLVKGVIAMIHQIRKITGATIVNWLELGTLAYRFNPHSLKQTMKILDEGKRQYKDNIEYSFMCSLFYEAVQTPEKIRHEQWAETIGMIFKKGWSTKQLGQSVNTNVQLDPVEYPHLGSKYAIKFNTLKKLIGEVRIGGPAREATKDREDVGIVKIFLPHAEYEIEGTTVAAMGTWMIDGKPVYQLGQEKGLEAIEHTLVKTAELNAICHAVTPLELSEYGEINLYEKILAKFNDPEFKRALVNGGITNYDPFVTQFVAHMCHVIELYKSSRKVINFDCHPEQTMKLNTSPRVERLDMEDKGVTADVLDNANHFIYWDSLPSEWIIQAQVDGYQRGHKDSTDVKILGPETFMQHSLTMSLMRILSLASAWSSGARPAMWEHRPKILNNGIEVINMLDKRFHAEYTTHGEAYEGIQKDFERMATALRV